MQTGSCTATESLHKVPGTLRLRTINFTQAWPNGKRSAGNAPPHKSNTGYLGIPSLIITIFIMRKQVVLKCTKQALTVAFAG